MDKVFKKMNKQTKTGLIIGGVAIAGYIAYTLLKKDPDEGTPATEPVADQQAYLNKVKELQKLINTGVDGIIGKNTKAALAKYGYTGTVTPDNIDSVLSSIRGKISAINTQNARYAKGLQILTYLKNKGGNVKFNTTTTVNVYEKDAFGKYNKTDKQITFRAGDTFKPLYMINSTPTDTFGTGFAPGFMMFKIKRPLDFNYLFTTAPDFFVGAISSFSITVV